MDGWDIILGGIGVAIGAYGIGNAYIGAKRATAALHDSMVENSRWAILRDVTRQYAGKMSHIQLRYYIRTFFDEPKTTEEKSQERSEASED